LVSIILDTIVVVECIRRLLSTAPCADIAGDLVSVLRPASVLAGHNISFDRNFLIGVAPDRQQGSDLDG
jgi:hypothetical protein